MIRISQVFIGLTLSLQMAAQQEPVFPDGCVKYDPCKDPQNTELNVDQAAVVDCWWEKIKEMLDWHATQTGNTDDGEKVYICLLETQVKIVSHAPLKGGGGMRTLPNCKRNNPDPMKGEGPNVYGEGLGANAIGVNPDGWDPNAQNPQRWALPGMNQNPALYSANVRKIFGVASLFGELGHQDLVCEYDRTPVGPDNKEQDRASEWEVYNRLAWFLLVAYDCWAGLTAREKEILTGLVNVTMREARAFDPKKEKKD